MTMTRKYNVWSGSVCIKSCISITFDSSYPMRREKAHSEQKTLANPFGIKEAHA